MTNAQKTRPLLSWLGLLLLLALPVAHAEQTHYPSPEAAAQALIDAASRAQDDATDLKAVLGPDAPKLLSGDPVADNAALETFIERSLAKAGIEQADESRAQLLIGEEEWPFAIPLVKEEQGWRFDTAAGLEEVYRRRIGGNELNAIAVLHAYVDVQQAYASEDRDADGVKEYAQRINSSQGRKDGLYWPSAEGVPESPLGPLVAEAVTEGYGPPRSGTPRPYNGYFFRILTRQGEHASNGAREYVKDGNMTEGFALIAYPAIYANSGIMSFIVNQRGVIFDADLGENTAEVAREITAFDPDSRWNPVKD